MIRRLRETTSQAMTFRDGDIPMQLTSHDRLGMSLTELLVVIAILGLLSITVIPALNSNNDARRTRAACRAVSSYLAKAQARSVGRTTWSGFKILASSSTSFAADRLVIVDCPEPYRGDSATAAVTVTAGASGTATPVVPGDFTRLSSLAITDRDVIRFDGRGPLYHVATASPAQILFGLRNSAAKENLGQSFLNTPWPSAGPHSIEIFRQPTPAGVPLLLPEDRAIDLQWSGYGSAAFGAPLTSTFGAGATITVLCDNSGRLRQFSVTDSSGNTSITTATVPLFLLVGRFDRAGNPQAPIDPNDDTVGANWQHADSWWLAMDPSSGIVKASECNATATTFADSQLFIRQALTNTVGQSSGSGN